MSESNCWKKKIRKPINNFLWKKSRLQEWNKSPFKITTIKRGKKNPRDMIRGFSHFQFIEFSDEEEEQEREHHCDVKIRKKGKKSWKFIDFAEIFREREKGLWENESAEEGRGCSSERVTHAWRENSMRRVNERYARHIWEISFSTLFFRGNELICRQYLTNYQKKRKGRKNFIIR